MPSPIDVAAAHERRWAVVAYIGQYAHERGYGPSRSAIADHFGVSLGTVNKDLAWLRDHGRVTWERNKPRTLRLT